MSAGIKSEYTLKKIPTGAVPEGLRVGTAYAELYRAQGDSFRGFDGNQIRQTAFGEYVKVGKKEGRAYAVSNGPGKTDSFYVQIKGKWYQVTPDPAEGRYLPEPIAAAHVLTNLGGIRR